MRAGGTPDDLKGLLGLQAVPLGHDSLGLLDCDAGLERVLELCAPLIVRLGDREEPADRCGCLVARTVAESLDRLHLGPILQGDDFSRDSRPAEFSVRWRLQEFELLDRAGNMFIVLPGHEDLLVEDVVDASNGYVVVRKRDLAARFVEQAQQR